MLLLFLFLILQHQVTNPRVASTPTIPPTAAAVADEPSPPVFGDTDVGVGLGFFPTGSLTIILSNVCVYLDPLSFPKTYISPSFRISAKEVVELVPSPRGTK
jgi:hypothetical protein